MKTPIFNLDRYHVTQFAFKANPNFTKPITYEDGLEILARVYFREGSPNRFFVSLFLATPNGDDPKDTPVAFNIGLMGYFSVAELPEQESEEWEKFVRVVYVNAASLLYSTAREIIRSFVSLSPFAKYYIPCERFDPEDAMGSYEFVEEKNEDDIEEVPDKGSKDEG